MEGDVVGLQSPFFALGDKEGKYEIKGVPAGEHSVKAWYPNPKKLKAKTAKATVTAGQAASLDLAPLRAGRFSDGDGVKNLGLPYGTVE